ncbi:rod shape-determining protein MreD [Paenibacillus pinihumi]|uniref:rod shape-determining protein MreD n=1 Tax=Paenibacillus pinihumi TaxID=669462 RepID=UPI0003FDA59D|nr:rod shape-determining protein MreD [Paenibacillus pinihumi]
MKLHWIILIMFVLFLLEGTIVSWLVPEEWTHRLIPHFVFVFVLFSSMYAGRHVALFLGLAFGMLQDIVFYGHIIGVHSFSMGLCGYLAGLLLEYKRAPMLTAISVIGMGCLLLDTVTFMIYTVFQINKQPYVWALTHHILPSLFLQLIFALIFYIPARRWFEGAYRKKTKEENE